MIDNAFSTLLSSTPKPHVLLVTLNWPGVRAFNEKRKPEFEGH